jgi:hypothetical protein
MVIGAFLLYSRFLEALQGLFLTESIKFLLNVELLNFLQTLKKFSYPANSLASIALGQDMLKSILIAGVTAIVSLVVIFVSTNALYKLTLYRNAAHVKRGRKKMIRRRTVLGGLMRKEFISVFREPKHMFSYFPIALSMPFMVYCCYTLFDTLILNAIGLRFEFSLALTVILVFAILTNTFCATNITRDGLTNLKIKVIPVEPSKILHAKVVFCVFVSSISVILSSVLLIADTSLSFGEGMFCALVGIIFSITQVFIATRIDLNRAKISSSPSEVEAASSKIIAKVVFLGLLVALVIGILAVIITILSNGSNIDAIQKLNLKESYAYIITLLLCILYFGAGFVFYNKNIKKSFDNLTL